MINLDWTKPGDILLGKQTKGVDDRWYRPRFTVVRVDKTKEEVEVLNKNQESQTLSACDLFTIEGTLRFMDGQVMRARQETRDARKLVIEIATAAANSSPEIAEKLEKYLKELTTPRVYSTPEVPARETRTVKIKYEN